MCRAEGLLLMCKDREVYDLATETVLNEKLLPGFLKRNPCNRTIKEWMKFRYSSQANILARKLRGITFGQGNRQRINEVTGAFSLSDCYWIKHKNSTQKFEQASPYFVDFWKGIGEYKGGAIPSLYVGGVIAKYWDSKENLIKVSEDCKKEVLAVQLCEAAGIPCVSITETAEGICVKNFTDANKMLEQADASGKFNENFTSKDVVQVFGERGIEMLTIDAITGKMDRHAGNFGFLRDANTGDYLGMAPLYDFDQTLEDNDQCSLYDLRQFPKYREKVMQIAKTAIDTNLHPVFTERAKILLNILEGRELQYLNREEW